MMRQVMSDPTSKTAVAGRLRLWLRSERAMGMGSVAYRQVERAPAAPQIQQAPPAVIPVRPTVPVSIAASIAAPHVAAQPTPSVEVLIPEQLGGHPMASNEKQHALAELDAAQVKVCRLCRLCETRTNTVFGEGDPDAKIFFIGEGPGETEDNTGRPFVGRAGELLDKMIAGMGLKREQVFIANIVKCRPPGNRVPAPDEVAACTPYLVRQLEIIRPRVIVTLGLPSAKYMLKVNETMGRLRGVWHDWRGIKLMPTYHPAFLLRAYTPENRAAVWSDLKQVMAEVGLKARG
jgi:DNA polymerase